MPGVKKKALENGGGPQLKLDLVFAAKEHPRRGLEAKRTEIEDGGPRRLPEFGEVFRRHALDPTGR